jgi:predicted restriction endonuclease
LEDARKKTLGAITRRQGQPIFRKKLLLAYGSRCAISECRVTETLEAAHIIGYRGEKTNHISNGLLLRTDLHTLFDLGMIAINDDYRVSIVPSLVGTEYDQWNGKRILLPSNPSDRPSLVALRIHRIAAGL